VSRWPRWLRVALLLAPALLVSAVFVIGGLGQVVLGSVGRRPLVGEPTWSLAAYREVLTDPAFTASVAVTLRVALTSTALATVLGVALALAVRRLGGRTAMTTLFHGTLAVPHLVGALCIGLLLSPSGFLSRAAAGVGLVDGPGQVPALTQDAFGWGIVAEYTWKETPFIAVVALAALGRGVRELEDVARTLGAGPGPRLRAVTLPLLAPPVAAASVLVLAFAIASYEVPRLLGRPFPAVLAVEAYERFRAPDLAARPGAMAVVTVLVALSVVAVLAYLRLVTTLTRRSV
jgi:putative spermidine/putrescine transport system permease protein